jgi:XapX domain-containing protein
MSKIVIGLAVGLLIGAGCRFFDIPVPSPPKLVGALLVVAMTVGYAMTDRYLAKGEASTASLCGGPTGETVAQTGARAKGTNVASTRP